MTRGILSLKVRQRAPRSAKAIMVGTLAVFLVAIPQTAFPSPYEPMITPEKLEASRVYSPYVGRAYPDQVLFGDVHFQTNLSFDSSLIGTTLDVDAGYRFARGEKVTSNTGLRVQLIRPLDFLAISDHAEMIGLAPMVRDADPILLADPWGKWLYERFNAGPEGRMEGFGSIIEAGTKGVNPFSSDEATASIWQNFVEKAETYNEPGRFTAMIGFEWSSTPNGNNLHRVVVFGDGVDKTSRTVPFSLFDSQDPEDLWKNLQVYEAETGGRGIAIPHNGNVSNGLLFNEKIFEGGPLTKTYAETRMRWEPIIEVTQIKGDGETHPLLSTEDEFADYET
jgi:hypothetical protein